MKRSALLILLVVLAGVMFTAAGVIMAQEATPEPEPIEPTFHPAYPLLDADGSPVLTSGAPVSTVTTCGACHDTAFITSHTQHGDGGRTAAGALPPEQIASTDVEMNCFLCHFDAPNNQARLSALATDPAWASTATLVDTGIVSVTDGVYTYNTEAFSADGSLNAPYTAMQDPRSDHCGACHGEVHMDAQIPLALALGDDTAWRTLTTGQVISPQRIAAGGANISGRSELGRAWDIHAERVLNCVDCHFSLNNPIYAEPNAAAAPDHLVFDPRRIDISEYVERPSHEFASGSDAMRTCESCHDAQTSHTWLPYWDRHTSALACETCHVPTLYSPALASRDSTVVTLDGSPVDTFRGIDGGLAEIPADPLTALVTGYQPVLLQQIDADGSEQLSPYNLVTVWYWVSGEEAADVPMETVRAGVLEGDAYAADVLAALDGDGDGVLSQTELVLDTDAKIAVIAERLTALGVVSPHIVGEVIPYAIHHNVIGGEWAIRECSDCHSENSRIVSALPLTSGGRTPGGVTPMLISDESVDWNGAITRDDNGSYVFVPETQTSAATLYIFGRDSVAIIDTLGVLITLGASLGVIAHATLRVITGRRRAAAAHAEGELKHVYMYSIYERQWHWLQTFVIFGLTFTGLVVHKPDMFSLFSFGWMVDLHNLFAILLVINAALSLFYHLASGEIKQFIPRPYGFFDNMVQQALYYLRGIFRGEAHPFEKDRDSKMNPIQQMTYLALLNVLLPLQIITGVLMWGAQQFPQMVEALGGLPFLAPFHTLIAWLLVTFVIVHVYMTTTGHTPLTNIKAMVMGYDDVEAHEDGHAEAAVGD